MSDFFQQVLIEKVKLLISSITDVRHGPVVNPEMIKLQYRTKQYMSRNATSRILIAAVQAT